MAEHLKLGIGEKLGTLFEKVRGERKKLPKENAPTKEKKDGTKEKKDGIIEWALRLVATRIVSARSVGELSDQLRDISSTLGSGRDGDEVDGLRAAVMYKVGELTKDETNNEVQKIIGEHLAKGDVVGAATYLRERAIEDRYKIDPTKQKEVDTLLAAVVDLTNEKSSDDKIIEQRISTVENKGNDLRHSVDKELTEISRSNDKVEAQVARKYVEGEKKKPAKIKKAKRKVEAKKDEIIELKKQADGAVKPKDRDSTKDNEFVGKLLGDGYDGFGTVDAKGDLAIEIAMLDDKQVKYMYARINTILGKYKAELGKPDNVELNDYLKELDFELREKLFELQEKAREEQVARGLTEDEIIWENLSPAEKAKIKENFDFIDKNMSAEKLLQHAQEAHEQRGLRMTRSEVALEQLFTTRPELRAQFNEAGEWMGSAEDFFELCRLEIYKIRDSVPEDRLGNLVFEDTAQTYLALMSISTKNNPELKQMKDAVTKTLYLEFVVKSLWKAGGNHEAWQRAAGLILREGGDTNFFLTMKVREKLRGVNKEGKETPPLPGFNIDDMLTLGELKAPNGQSWLAYISTDNISLNEVRLQELGNGLAKMTLEKAKLRKNKNGKKELSDVDYAKFSALLNNNEIEFDKEQLSWVRNYMQYIHTATLNVGEKLWLMDGKKPGDIGWEYASLPGGQFAEKSGLWPILYFAKYQVTKYGFEGLGKLFIPNPGLLSYARSETLRHFMVVDGNDDWVTNPDGTTTMEGSGAKDFFFGGVDLGTVKQGNKEIKRIKLFTDFWEEIWLDSRTGDSFKSKGMRSLQNSRDVGLKMIREGKHNAFIKEMKFDQLEMLVGHEIPGGSNEEKLTWVVANLDYDMMQMKTMPSKREGDWVNKYSKYYVETVTLFQDFLDSPTLSNKMKILLSVAKYNSATLPNLSKQLDDFMADKRKYKPGLMKGGNPLNPFHYLGPKTVSSDQKDLTRSADGDSMEMPIVGKSATDGWYPGRGLKLSLEEYKEGKRNPMVMRKIEIQNAIAWGVVSPQEGGQMMRDWQKMIYFGEQVELGKLKLRPGMIPFLTPYFLFRGWWVDKQGFDWEDFKLIMSKQNDETWQKLKKLLGIEI